VSSVPLAGIDNLEGRLGRDLSTEEVTRAESILVDVSAAVRNYTGRTFTAQDHTLRTRVHHGEIRLPQRPVLSVTSVHGLNFDGTVGTAVAGWFFDGIDTLCLPGPGLVINATTPRRGRWPVEIVYRAGYENIPDDIVGIVCSVALRALGRQPLEGGLTSESIDGYSYSVGAAGAAGPFGFLDSERAVLDTYQLPAGSISVSR